MNRSSSIARLDQRRPASREIREHGDKPLRSSSEELVRVLRGSLSWERFGLYRKIICDKNTPDDEVPVAHVIWTFAFDCNTGTVRK